MDVGVGVHIPNTYQTSLLSAQTIARTTDVHKLDFTGKKLALSFIAHEFVDGQLHSYPPDVIDVKGVPGPSRFFFFFFFFFCFVLFCRSSASV